MELKKCKKCELQKPMVQFSKNISNHDNLDNYCRDCKRENNIHFRRTKDGVAQTIYDGQLKTSKKRQHNPPKYTKQELMIWMYRQDIFHLMYAKWVESGYIKDLKPSIDRLNDFKGYSFENIRLVTWKENREKQSKDISLARSTSGKSKCKPVIQFDLNNNKINEFISINEAMRQTNIRHIHSVCNGKRKTAGGYYWAYKQE